ncbi:MAG TPA: UDP-glucose/GDP-mannose dehydrogenase family protein [Gemmatimonadaceae bacterium]|nr:UDP-glucose/GDP-mannose dehydrogenase family protein [Gemmatimonadaceae bacterium]
MTTTISVFGLGYVGCVTAACLANEGFDVIGVDVNPAKVRLIAGGHATVVEEGIDSLVCSMVSIGRLRATLDAAEAVRQSTVSMICVGTPSRGNGSVNLAFVERVAEQIGHVLREKEERHVVALRSTVLPGTTTGMLIPKLEKASGKRAGRDFSVCMNPEFLREGTSLHDFAHPPFTIIGTQHEAAGKAMAKLYAGVNAPVHITAIEVAEMLKYACNSFHGVKVSFANEIGNLCKAVGADSHEVMRLFCEDRKLNISPSYLRPGFAFGGSCLGKDLRALVYRGKELDVETPVLSAALESNRKQVLKAFEMVQSTGRRRVGVLGLSFKAGTDDLRESPIVTLVEMLIGKGHTLSIYDRFVSHSGVMGANREYIEREIPHIWSLMRDNVSDVVDTSDLIVIGNDAPEFRQTQSTLREDQLVVDLVRAFNGQVGKPDRYQGICW